MKPFARIVTAALPALLMSACGATVMSREVESEDRDLTGLERLEREAEEKEVEGPVHGPEESAPESSGMVLKEKDEDERREAEKKEPEKHALSAKGESVWSSGSAETVVDRARRQLRRRCDSKSQAACKALPDVDYCANRQGRSCARLGELYARGATGVDRNPEHARDFWLKACEIAPTDCVRYGRILFDIEGLEQREAVAEYLFETGCTREFKLCVDVGRFYEEKKDAALSRKFFDLGCAGGQTAACQEK